MCKAIYLWVNQKKSQLDLHSGRAKVNKFKKKKKTWVNCTKFIYNKQKHKSVAIC